MIKVIVKSFLREKLGRHPVKIFIIFWLVLCTSISLVIGGQTQKTVEKLYDVKYEKMDGLFQVLFNPSSDTYHICYNNSEKADVIETSNIELVPERKYGPNKGVVLLEQSKKVLNCSNINFVKVETCPSAWRTAEHCYLEGQFNMLKLFKKDRVPQLIEYHSVGVEVLNTDNLLYLPIAVILDAVLVPLSILWMLLFAVVAHRG